MYKLIFNNENPTDEMLLEASQKASDKKGINYDNLSNLIYSRIMNILEDKKLKPYKKRKLINELESFSDTRLFRAAYFHTKIRMYGSIIAYTSI